MRQRRGRRERNGKSGGQSTSQPGEQAAAQSGVPGADQPVGGSAPARPPEPTVWPDTAAPPGTDAYGPARPASEGYGPPRPNRMGYGAPEVFLPSEPQPRLRFDPPPTAGQWQRHDSQPQPGSWQQGDPQAGYDHRPDGWLPGFQPRHQHDDQRPSYGPAQPADQTRPRPQGWPGDQAGTYDPRSYGPRSYEPPSYQPGPHEPRSQAPRPSYEPRPPFEPNRDQRPPWEQPSYSGQWQQAQPDRGYETRAPFEPLTSSDPRPTGQPAPGQVPPGGTQGPPQQRSLKQSRRRLIVIVAVVVVLLLGFGAAGGAYLLLRTHGSPTETAASYLAAWQRGDYRAMDRVSVNMPHGGLAGPISKAKTQLGVKHDRLTLGTVTTSGTTAKARFSVTDYLASNHVWTYHGQLSLVVAKRKWWVRWSPSAIYPGLAPGERFALSAVWPPRAPILASDGTDITSPAAVAQSGSLALLTGYLGPATTAQAKALGAPYRKGDVIGQSGIELAYQNQLAGRPSLTIKVVGPGKRVDATAMRFAAKLGRPVRTSINMAAQIAASHAVSSAKTSKPVDVVAMQASTGRVLAVVERPGGFDRALQGIFPPGSTFKVVTASALARTGLTPASTVQCPSQVNIGGRVFHNDKNEHLGTTNLQTAFAVSCNSTFALLATQRLSGTSLASMARVFGFNARPELGLPATLGHFSTPHDPVDLAADAFGQGLDLVNPLSQASEVAAIDAGVWRPPLLVVSPKPHQKVKSHVISATILNTLRPMMRAVVTSGTAAGVGFPPGVYGKTGTAEYGTGPHPNAHGWFIGYQGDIAFAVLVEGGGYGADSAGPIAKAFLHNLNG